MRKQPESIRAPRRFQGTYGIWGFVQHLSEFQWAGFINRLKDLSPYAMEHKLDGFVVEGRAYLMKESDSYRAYVNGPNRLGATS